MRLYLNVVLLLVSCNAHAALLFEQPVTGNRGLFSNLNAASSQQDADNFSLASASNVSEIVFWGAYQGFDLSTQSDVDFTIRLFETAGATPVIDPFFEQQVTATFSPTGLTNGVTFGDQPIYRFTASSLSIDLAAGTEYWLSILESDLDTLGSAGIFEWSPSSILGSGALRNLDSTVWGAFPRNSAFALHGEELSAIPVPAAFWLFGTALVGLVGFSKRRKASR